jgi:Fic family protein
MRRQTGRFEKSTTLGEVVNAFIPFALPPCAPELDPACYDPWVKKAELALARLSAVAGLVPSVDWLLYSAIRKEALLTSQIEGTQATITDLFDEEAGLEISNTEDVEEVTNYIAAYKWVRKNLKDPQGLPISIRLLCEAHERLLNGVRGNGKQPGTLRRSQNWIGGTRPGNAVFVPPPAEKVPELLSDLEKFIHQQTIAACATIPKNPTLPALVVIALVHAQFEIIHPFLDGNGRIGRLLITALFEDMGVLPEPLMYLSGYLKQHQIEYYRLLSAVRHDGDWESWITFFLEAVCVAAADAEKNIVQIAHLVASDRRKLLEISQSNGLAYRLFECLPLMPRFTVERARKALSTSFPSANAAVKWLEKLGIIEEVTGNKKNRSFSYKAYIQLLSS